MRLLLSLLAPFALVAIYHHLLFASMDDPSHARRVALGNLGIGSTRSSRPAARDRAPSSTVGSSLQMGQAHKGIEDRAAEAVGRVMPSSVAVATASPAAVLPPASRDVSVDYPAPTLSTRRLLDSSENWLPVPDAESAAPSDLAWRRAIPWNCRPAVNDTSVLRADRDEPYTPPVQPPGCVCPGGRRPYHTILTAQASAYQRWQTLIFFYHFRKAQRANPCTEMVGFTRLLASSNGVPDDLMKYMPTVTVPQLAFDKTRGFQVINRPWTMLQFLQTMEWNERIVEEYVFIAETDHLLIADLPNRATPRLNVAFFFPCAPACLRA